MAAGAAAGAAVAAVACAQQCCHHRYRQPRRQAEPAADRTRKCHASDGLKPRPSASLHHCLRGQPQTQSQRSGASNRELSGQQPSPTRPPPHHRRLKLRSQKQRLQLPQSARRAEQSCLRREARPHCGSNLTCVCVRWRQLRETALALRWLMLLLQCQHQQLNQDLQSRAQLRGKPPAAAAAQRQLR